MKLLHTVERQLWLEVAQASPAATFFHTPHWQEIALGSFGHTADATLGAILPSGVRAVLPLICIGGRGPLRDLCSSFELCYGGVIADGPLSTDQAAALYGAARGWRTRRLWLAGSPLADLAELPAGFATEQDCTHLIRLEPSFETSFARLPHDRRSAYRQGLAKGVTVRAAASLGDIDAYYGIYENGLRRWAARGVGVVGRPYSVTQFRRCFELAQRHPESARLWLAEVDGEVVAGSWVFTWRRHAICWHGAVHSDYMRHQPRIVLHVEIMREAVARGCTLLDFGPSGGVAGVVAFKEGYGAERRSFTRAQYVAPAVELAGRLRDRARPFLAHLQDTQGGS